MDPKQTSLDEILLEVELSNTQMKKADDPDVDQLLKELLQEKKDRQETPPPPKPSSEEPPTRVFKRDALKRQVRPAVPQAAPKKKEPPFFQKAEEAKKAALKSSAIYHELSEKKPLQPETPSAPKLKTPPKKMPAASETGKFSIDIDAIRAEQPAPHPIPAQDLSEEPAVPSTELLHKKLPLPPEPQRIEEEFAPAFRRAGARIAAAPVPEQEALLKKEARDSLLLAAATGLLGTVILFLTILIGINRSADPPLLPTRLMLGLLTLLGAAAGGLSFRVVGGGIWSLLRFQPDRDSLPAVGYLLCLLQSVGQLLFPKGLTNPEVQIYLAAGVFLLCGGWLAHAAALRAAAVNAKFALSDYGKFVPSLVEDSRDAASFTQGLTEGDGFPVVNCKTSKLEGFLPISLGEDRSDRNGRNFALAGLIAGGAAAILLFILTKNKNLAVTVLVALSTIFAPIGSGFATAFPLRRGASVLNRLSAFAAGETSVEDGMEVSAAVVDASDLIPPSSVTLSGIKTFAGMRIDEAILDAASVLIEAGSVLSGVFLDIIARRTELLRKVDSVSFEDGMGLSGWIVNRRILIGNRALMEAHGIRAPSEDYERRFRDEGSDLVYLAASGDLMAVFVITLTPSPDVDNAVQLLVENDILLSVHTTDSFLTADRLASLYLCDRSCFKILPSRLHDRFAYYRQPASQKAASIVNNGSIQSMAASLAVPRRMKILMYMGWVIRLVSVILGTALVLMLALLGALEQFSPPVLVGWLLSWLLVELLAERLIRIH